MDFFEHQERARRRTLILFVYFSLAVGFIVIGVYLATLALLMRFEGIGKQEIQTLRMWRPNVFLITTGCTLILIASGSLYKINSLRQGGSTVAELLGGRRIDPGTKDPDERKVLNVVEEVAIASGTPVPPVYLMRKEYGINAFAAGLRPGDAAIGVTQGCIDHLDRNELQGVIAHEFSHALNGDMRLNIILMGLLHGILLIAIVGRETLETVAEVGDTGRRSKGGGIQKGLVLFGLTLLVIGYIGVFFGRLIKSAVSRQREFLADASAVQFTRYPEGIANALKKIGGCTSQSLVRNPHAEEASHMFFGNALKLSFFSNMFATHPPLYIRIRRIDPSFVGEYIKVVTKRKPAILPFARRPAQLTITPHTIGEVTEKIAAAHATGEAIAIAPAAIVSQVGTSTAEHLNYAKDLRNSIPERLRDAAREAYSARAVIYSLLLDKDEIIRTTQMECLSKFADPAVFDESKKLLPDVMNLHPKQRLPLVDMTLPILQEMSNLQFDVLRDNVKHLVKADDQLNLFEFTIQQIVRYTLEPGFYPRKKTHTMYYSLLPIKPQCEALLSALVHQGSKRPEAAARAFAVGEALLAFPKRIALNFLPKDKAGNKEVGEALDKIRFTGLIQKKSIIQACTACIASDKKVTVEEAELLRAVATALECPLPPFLPGQSLT